jgi:multiple sugar transport system permease protein
MKTKKNIFTFYVPLVLIFCFIVLPFVWMILTSFKSYNEMFDAHLSYLPREWIVDNYVSLFTQTKFLLAARNSLTVAFTTVCINIVISSMASYGLTRYRFKSANAILKAILLIYMLPQVLFLTPLFILMKNLGILNSLISLVVSYCTFTVPFSVWLMVGFMNQFPMEIEEAARIDGCSKLKAFFHVGIPILRPGIAATCTYIFINSWNEYLYAVMFTNGSTRTLTVEIASYIGQYAVEWCQLTAGGVMAALPVVIMFIFVQKNFISGSAK